MPIQTLSLKNYGVFRNAELLGLSPLSIIAGANGTGKSTLFDVLPALSLYARNIAFAVSHRRRRGEGLRRPQETGAKDDRTGEIALFKARGTARGHA